MALMGFEIGPRTLHNFIHDPAFALFVLDLLPAFFFLWRRFKEDALWQNHARYTLITGILATLLHFLPGVAYFPCLTAVFVWFEVTAFRPWRLSG